MSVRVCVGWCSLKHLLSHAWCSYDNFMKDVEAEVNAYYHELLMPGTTFSIPMLVQCVQCALYDAAAWGRRLVVQILGVFLVPALIANVVVISVVLFVRNRLRGLVVVLSTTPSPNVLRCGSCRHCGK